MRVTNRPYVRAVVILLAVTSAIGCVDPMDDGSLVETLRVLAVRAEPPEIAPGQGTVLTALFADPKGGDRDVTFLWLVAAGIVEPNYGFPCADLLAEPYSATAADGGDRYETPTTPDDAIERIGGPGADAAHFTVLVIACGGGSALSAAELAQLGSLDLRSDLCHGGEGMAATKVIRVSRSEAPNTNPTIDEVRLAEEVLQEEATETEIPSCAPGAICEKMPLEVSLTESSFEVYDQGEMMSGVSGDKDEILYVSWFTTTGDLGDARSIVEDPGSPATNRLSLEKDDPDSLTLYVVAHDNRRGVDWRVVSLFR